MSLAAAMSPERVAMALIAILIVLVVVIWLPGVLGGTSRNGEPLVSPSPTAAAALDEIERAVLAR